MKTLLIVENNIDFAYVVAWHFEQKGMSVHSSSKGEEALDIYQKHSPDIVLLDINLDGEMDGKDVARSIRKTDKHTPIIFMSGESKSPKDVVEGFDIGCNFFLKKPVSVEEIEVHINALLDRTTIKSSYKIACVLFRFEDRVLFFEDKKIYLSEKEAKVLQILSSHPNSPIELQTFFDNIWSGELAEESLRNNISSLRKKIADTPLLIETLKGKGYYLKSE